MTVAISQSNYIPWRGYFDMISKADVFVIYDDMQFTRRDWRNRNKIKTPQGVQWLTVPVEAKGKYFQKINETRIFDKSWAEKHLKTIEHNYRKALYFDEYFPIVRGWYKEGARFDMLSELNLFLLKAICELYSIQINFRDSREFKIIGSKTEALISVLQQIDGVEKYLSGPSAKSYINEKLFQENGISLEWMDYSHLQPYEQVYSPFDNGVTILDHLFCMGINTSN